MAFVEAFSLRTRQEAGGKSNQSSLCSSANAAGGFCIDLVRYAVLSRHRSGIHAERLLSNTANAYSRPASDGRSDSHIRLLFVQIKRRVRDVVAVRGFPPLGSGLLPDDRRYFADQDRNQLPAANEAAHLAIDLHLTAAQIRSRRLPSSSRR
jgi:hypothetical protein